MKSDLDVFVSNNRNRVIIVEYFRDSRGIVYKGVERTYNIREQKGISGRKKVEARCNELRKKELYFNIPQED